MSNKKTHYFVSISAAILAVGLGTGFVASYMGLPVSVFSSSAAPEELQYRPGRRRSGRLCEHPRGREL